MAGWEVGGMLMWLNFKLQIAIWKQGLNQYIFLNRFVCITFTLNLVALSIIQMATHKGLSVKYTMDISGIYFLLTDLIW